MKEAKKRINLYTDKRRLQWFKEGEKGSMLEKEIKEK
jgi:hypothetical protein